MFTVKKIDPDGVESGKEIKTWIFFPEPGPLSETLVDPNLTLPKVSVYIPEGDYWEDYTEGTIYIMNSRGSTVATYVLPIRMTEAGK